MRPVTLALPGERQQVLQVASGLSVSLYAGGLRSPRFMALGPRGDVFVGSWFSGNVDVLINRGGGPSATRDVHLLTGLYIPNSVAYSNGLLYVAEQTKVSVFRYNPNTVKLSDRRVLISGLPPGGRHVTRTVSLGPDGLLYVSIGSSCNVCVEADKRRATIMRFRIDGSHGEIFARGMRNAVGLAWQPGVNVLWATVNGRDLLGDNMPPDLVTAVHRGDNFGWPYCYGLRHPDPNVPPPPGYCASMTLPTVPVQAHSAPLGMVFANGGLYVAYHGSWNRSRPTGYKIVFIPFHDERAGTPHDVLTGWLPSNAVNGSDAWGRPVGLLQLPDSSLLVSDDLAGVIYRVTGSRG
ncbi:MAG: L-sorbosone dehydrogenase [Chloroflexi bacterium]|nr:L-sorbosone dehydrogenase [Chloroflexota bacterium]